LVARYGGGIVEVTFDGPPPDIAFDGAVSSGSSVRLRTDDPGRAAAETLARLGPEARRVRAIEVVRPGLEAVYLSLTGRRGLEEGEGVVDRDAA
jgi:ABC-2 type transport system ATP-binding protein